MSDPASSGSEGSLSPDLPLADNLPTNADPQQTVSEGAGLSQTRETLGALGGGRFSILRKLGQGGMGTVYLARDNVLLRDVALKIPKTDSEARQRTMMDRFLREARAVARLNHTWIARIYDVGELDGASFLAMEFIEGQPLDELIGEGKRLELKDAAILIYRVATALQHAHERQIIHRDIKPGNIMVVTDGSPRVMDFGLSRIDDDQSQRITKDGQIVGSPAYMSPEQVSGKSLDYRTDIFSLGCILYEAITGQQPFRGTMTQVLLNISTGKFRQPTAVHDGVDPKLEEICLKMMEINRKRRFQSMQCVSDALDGWINEQNSPSPWEPEAESDLGEDYYRLNVEKGNPTSSKETVSDSWQRKMPVSDVARKIPQKKSQQQRADNEPSKTPVPDPSAKSLLKRRKTLILVMSAVFCSVSLGIPGLILYSPPRDKPEVELDREFEAGQETEEPHANEPARRVETKQSFSLDELDNAKDRR